MRRWSIALQEEVSGWPEVTSRPMFGLAGFYRAGTIFAALPRTRAVETPSSILLKLPAFAIDCCAPAVVLVRSGSRSSSRRLTTSMPRCGGSNAPIRRPAAGPARAVRRDL
jgi:hypothetical protein